MLPCCTPSDEMSLDKLPQTCGLQRLSPTPVHDLTTRIFNTSILAVGFGGFSDVFVGELLLPVMNAGSVPSCKVSAVLTVLLGPLVAIKVLRAFNDLGLRDKEKATKRLDREVDIFQRLHHPNVARFLGVSYHIADHPAIVMEWYGFGNAKRYLSISRPELSLRDRMKLVSGVLQGLLYLHTLDPPIVHGDLKANNVLVNNRHEAVLTDFGLSRVVEFLNRTAGSSTSSVGVGALRWRAPELLKISPSVRVTLPSDVWAFGCTTYEILTGKLPYSFHQLSRLIEASILSGNLPFDEPVPDVQVPPGMWNITSRCWAPKPEDRPSMKTLSCSLKIHLTASC